MRLIDADALLKNYGLENATKYGNEDAEQQEHSYSTMMLYEIADMIEDAPTVEAKHEWIPCSEGYPLPVNDQEVLTCDDRGNIQIDTFYEGEFEDSSFYGDEIVAWMPLPAPYNAGMRGGKNE